MPDQFAAGMRGWWAFCRSWRARICCDWLVNVIGSRVIMATMSLLWTCQSAIRSWIQSDIWGSAVFFVIMLLVTYLLWNFRWPRQSQAQQSQWKYQRSWSRHCPFFDMMQPRWNIGSFHPASHGNILPRRGSTSSFSAWHFVNVEVPESSWKFCRLKCYAR